MKFFVSSFFFFSSFYMQASDLVYGETSKIDRFDPYTVHEVAAHRLSDMIFDNLIDLSLSGEYKSNLAKEWKILSGRNRVHVTLKKNIQWHNGKIFNADDIIATFKILKNPQSQIPNRSRFDKIDKIQKVDDWNVVFTFHQSLVDPIRYLVVKVLPSSSFQNQFFLNHTSNFSKHPIGTGPYKFDKANDQGEVLLSAYPRYHRGIPRMQRVILKSYNDQHIMTQSLMYNALDLVTWVSPSDLPEIYNDKNLQMKPYDSLEFSFIAINNQREHLKSKEVRFALNQAIHKKEMISSFFQKRGQMISGPFSPNSWSYNIDVPAISWNVERAKSVFAKHQLNQKRLQFVVPVTGKSQATKKVVLACQNYLERAGLKVDLVFLDWQQWKERVLFRRDYDLALASWSFDDANNIKSLFHSENNKKGGYNFVGFSNHQVDSLLTEAHLTSDFDKKRAIHHKIHALLSEESPYIWLWTLQNHAAHRNQVFGVQIGSFSFFQDVEKWHKQSINI